MGKEVIKDLKPELIWDLFYELDQVPRPSKEEEKIREYTKEFARKNNFSFDEDSVGNIVIKVPATPGYEDKPTVVLQGHLDMVCEKNKGTEHDFSNDPIKFVRDGDWIKADGTTLGADNGIGVAAGMAAALDEDVVHGPLELLCTIDEETGMTGVNALQPGFIKGKILLNMDSEEDGAFYIGCSGGVDTVALYNIKSKSADEDFSAYDLNISGLKGGHSGLDIHSGKANAIKILGNLLHRFVGLKYRIASINGGSKRNAIPREAEVKLMMLEKDEETIREIIKNFQEDTLSEIKMNDGGLTISLEKSSEKPENVFSKKFSKKIISTLMAMPHGVISMSPSIPGLVETSTNLATINTDGGTVRIGTSQRSSNETAKTNISNGVAALFSLSGASEVILGDGYPGWQPNIDSEILKVSKKVYKELFSKEPEVKAIHAGLETGILGTKYDGLDMISFGPTIEGAHSPDERLYIPAVENFYNLLKGILKELAK